MFAVPFLQISPAKGGFSFDLCPRNGMLEKKGLKVPGFRKTGTTIVGLVFAVCMGAFLVFSDSISPKSTA